LKKGQPVDAVITAIDPENRRMSLSIKDLEPNAWNEFVATHKPGDLVKGKIARFASFGAFVELGDNLEGLCHISELSDERVAKPEDAVELGQEMEFRVLRIDAENKKIGLSARAAALEDPIVETKIYTSDAGGGIGYFSRPLAREIDECGERSRRDAGIDDQAGRVIRDRRNRREVLDDVERGLLVLNEVDRVCERDCDADGGSVGRRALEHIHADGTGRTHLILDDNGLAQAFAQFRCDQPRADIARTAGRIRHDDTDRARWKLLRLARERQQRKGGEKQCVGWAKARHAAAAPKLRRRAFARATPAHVPSLGSW